MILQVEAALLNAKPQHPEESLLQIENMQQTVMAINALSKVFIYISSISCHIVLVRLCLFLFHVIVK